MNAALTFDLIPPRIVPVLDPGFRPAILANRAYRAALEKSGAALPLTVAVEQADGSVFHFPTVIQTGGSDAVMQANAHYLERLIKFLLWSRGGYRVYLPAPAPLVQGIARHYSGDPTGKFDAEIMGDRIYERPFEIAGCDASELPRAHEATRPLGRHLDGCRIGFDLGASDRKVAAVIDGEVVFSDETVWSPAVESDPRYHFDGIMDSLSKAAAHLPRVDAIGGSAAGVYVNNRVKVASLFRAVSREDFDLRVKDIFLGIRKAWNNVPLEVVNDGEVTALAGSMSMGSNGVLGIALGSSQAGGYVTTEGTITSWLNELAFVPVDYRSDAPADEWSGDYGCGVQYFSQQCVGRLMGPAGIETDPAMPLPEKLKLVQELMERGDARAVKIYDTIGVYLGYTIAHYADFYPIENILLLGRVMSGNGGGVIIERAQEVLRSEFEVLSRTITISVPGERDKRHGQAIAAASLPVIE